MTFSGRGRLPLLDRLPDRSQWRLRRKGREAKESGADPTDYTTSPTARSFVPFYAQRLSTACVLNGARSIQKSLKRKAVLRRSASVAA